MRERGRGNADGESYKHSYVPIMPRHTEEMQPERKKRRINDAEENISSVPHQGDASKDSSFLSASLEDLVKGKSSLGNFFVEKISKEQDLEAANKHIKAQNAVLRAEVESLTEDNKNLTEDNINLLKCLEYFKKREDGFRGEVLGVQKEYAVLDEKFSELQGEKAVLKEEFAKLTDSYERSINVAGRWDKLCSLTQIELQEKQNELEKIKEENALLKQQIIRHPEYTETSTVLSNRPHASLLDFESSPENSRFALEQFTYDALEQFMVPTEEGTFITQPIERAPGYWQERVAYDTGSPSFRGK